MAIKNVLVVDDSPTDTHLVTEILKKLGFNVICAASGEEGIATAKKEKPDLMLMDIVMPGMSGFEATRAISRDPETSRHSRHHLLHQGAGDRQGLGLRQGAKDYIVKPVNEKLLLEKLKGL